MSSTATREDTWKIDKNGCEDGEGGDDEVEREEEEEEADETDSGVAVNRCYGGNVKKTKGWGSDIIVGMMDSRPCPFKSSISSPIVNAPDPVLSV